jgi:Flp pilus assembly pilin Flp
MIRFIALFSTCFLASLVFENPAAGQAMVEYGLAAGTAATSTAPARGLKESIGGAFTNLDKILKSTQNQTDSKGQSSGVSRPSRPVPPKQAAAETLPAQAVLSSVVASPPPNYEDPATIQAGIGYEELLRRFGPPALQFTGGPDRRTMSYLGKSGAIQVEFQGGKVTSAERAKS